ncbi:MAG: threonylcarbamoyl-AMP synthase [Eubacterium sp.]|nr:threonylcarbamoyl-AMP synthase [Eubacterium sp.]
MEDYNSNNNSNNNLNINSGNETINTLLLSQSPEDIGIAAEILKSGGLVAFPTETVYGLGGDGLSAEAAGKIYAAKGRPSDNPLIVHIADVSDVEKLAASIPDKARALMEAFWPGPLTIILPKKSLVPDTTTGGLATVAIRMPSHPAALELIRQSGVYIAAPSANTSGRPSPTTAQHVMEDMAGRIGAVIDGGPVGIGIESTIVSLTGDIPTILRPGFITKQMLEAIIGQVHIDPALIKPDPNIRPQAPGMKYTHYSPKGQLTIVEDSNNPEIISQNVIDKINSLIEQNPDTVVLTTGQTADKYNTDRIILLGEDHQKSSTVASRLYAALRKCDEMGAQYILSENFSQGELGGAIMNRLLRAAGHKVIRTP